MSFSHCVDTAQSQCLNDCAKFFVTPSDLRDQYASVEVSSKYSLTLLQVELDAWIRENMVSVELYFSDQLHLQNKEVL